MKNIMKVKQLENKNQFLMEDDTRVIEAVKGTAKQRWAILNSCYASYLIGLGYTGFNWRDE